MASAPTFVAADAEDKPVNQFVTPMLTDFYQITMVYAYWVTKRHEDAAVFDLFFRKAPFKGEYAIFAGLEEVLRLLSTFRFTPEHIAYLRTRIPVAPAAFWEYLSSLDCSKVKLYAIPEGTAVFPRVPLIRVEGPLGVAQLLETPLLNLCNFASLVTTNAARHRLAAGPDKTLLEFGVRRAQGPDGAMSASRYSFVGGFDGTSNVAAGHLFGIPVLGTHAHAFVCSFAGPAELPADCRVVNGVDLLETATSYRSRLGCHGASDGELAAFVAYAHAFPNAFLALVDTYDTLSSGVPNFIAVALALRDAGHAAIGVRLDSGDLAYLSKETRRAFKRADELFGSSLASSAKIVASNDINETVLHALKEQGHEIDTFGIGTNLVTCQAQPALGMVYKLVEVNGTPRIKLSQETAKITIPGRKEVYRLVGAEGVPLLDVIIRAGEARPAVGKRILCRHPFDEQKRAFVTPTAVVPLLQLAWKGGDAVAEGEEIAACEGSSGGSVRTAAPSLVELRERVREQLRTLRGDHIRPVNPTPYKVSISGDLFAYMHALIMEQLPVAELS